MAVIKSGSSTDQWTIDPVSKAGRVTLYGPDGNSLGGIPTGKYYLPIAFRQSAATAAPAYVWCMRNMGPRIVYIKKIYMNVMFDGASAVSTSFYELLRFSGATPTGGTTLTIIKARNYSFPTSSIEARFLDTGLAVTGCAFEAAFASVGSQRNNGSSNRYEFSFSDPNSLALNDGFQLNLGEGLLIKLAANAVIGDGMRGQIEWIEP